jgi:hypothetical protein
MQIQKIGAKSQTQSMLEKVAQSSDPTALYDPTASPSTPLERAKEGLHSLMVYVQSEKFSQDPMVNKNDIILRINEILSAITDAEFAAQPRPKRGPTPRGFSPD